MIYIANDKLLGHSCLKTVKLLDTPCERRIMLSRQSTLQHTPDENRHILYNNAITTPLYDVYAKPAPERKIIIDTVDFIEAILFRRTDCMQTITLPPGTYMFQCWGASASTVCTAGIGAGAYTAGIITLTEQRTLYIYVGAEGNFDTVVGELTFNGGGENHATPNAYSKGGGATDIRLVGGNWNDTIGLRSRIMVAGGGSAIGSNPNSGVTPHAGGLVAFSSNDTRITPSNQISGFAFGYGRGGYAGQSYTAGGGGYYGGNTTTSSPYATSGGSSFISGHPGCDAIKDALSVVHTGQPNHYSGLVFTETVMKAGNQLMPDMNNSIMTGNFGDGFARILKIA